MKIHLYEKAFVSVGGSCWWSSSSCCSSSQRMRYVAPASGNCL